MPTNHISRESQKSNIMLCDKHVMCGSCPYEGRCKYIHDRAVASSHEVLMRRCRHEKETGVKETAATKDSFYWPNVPKAHGCSGPPRYDVSACCDHKFYLRHRAIYSMWKHFRQFCVNNSGRGEEAFMYDDSMSTINPHTGSNRLSVFVSLSNGISLDSSFPAPSSSKGPNQQCDTMPTEVPCAAGPEDDASHASPSRRSESDLSDASEYNNSNAYAESEEFLHAQWKEQQQRERQELFRMYQAVQNGSTALPSYGAPASCQPMFTDRTGGAPSGGCNNYMHPSVAYQQKNLSIFPREASRAALQSPVHLTRKSWLL